MTTQTSATPPVRRTMRAPTVRNLRRALAERPPWMGKPTPAFLVLRAVVLLSACILVVIPFVSVVSTSLSSQETLVRTGGFVVWPRDLSLEAYTLIFSGGVVTRSILVSLGVTVAGTAISLVCSTLLAYGLSRPRSYASKPLLMMVLFTLLFAPGLIPSYLVVRELGLLDTYWALVLPVTVNAFNVIVIRAFFMNIPEELIESAKLDGAGDLYVFLRIVLPLSKAVIAVIGLFYAVGYWNSFFTAMLYLDDTAKWPLQLVLRQFVVQGSVFGTDYGAEIPPPQQAIQMAILVISILPILIVYPFIQRHFAKGVLTGAVKG